MYSSFFKFSGIFFILLIIYSIFITISPFTTIESSETSEFIWPLPGNHNITCNFGPRIAPTSGASSFHYGIDIGASEGTPIYSCIDGKVIYTGFNRCQPDIP